jgi:hypothetical protein
MATENPTGDGRAVPLSIPAGNEAFLRRVIGAARDGIREDLERHGDQLRASRSELLLEETAYAAVLGGLDLGRIVADDEIRAALRRLAESVDRENEYERVVFEHETVAGLLDQLGGAVSK